MPARFLLRSTLHGIRISLSLVLQRISCLPKYQLSPPYSIPGRGTKECVDPTQLRVWCVVAQPQPATSTTQPLTHSPAPPSSPRVGWGGESKTSKTPGCGRGLAEILSIARAGKDPAAKRNGIKSSPAHSHSTDSLVREVIWVSVGTAGAEVVCHAKISVNNCTPSHLPEP